MGKNINKDQKIKDGDLEKTDILFGNDGIIYIKIGKDILKPGGLKRRINEVTSRLEKYSGKMYILAELMTVSFVNPPEWRRDMVIIIKDLLRNPKLEKIALYGGGSVARTMAIFVVRVIGQKAIKTFKTRKEAKEWLEE